MSDCVPPNKTNWTHYDHNLNFSSQPSKQQGGKKRPCEVLTKMTEKKLFL